MPEVHSGKIPFRKKFAALIILSVSINAFSQTSDDIRIDMLSNYELKIPGSLHLIETGSLSVFGGVLPAVDGIENAITVRSFPKPQFNSFNELKYVFFTGNKFAQPTEFDGE